MSYVRWSSDGYRSDVYAYADVSGGFTLHIAGRRRVGLDTLGPDPMETFPKDPKDPLLVQDWLKAYRAFGKGLDKLPFEDIKHPDAGETFNFATLEELRDKLAAYREEGVIQVPEWVVPSIEEELTE